MLAVTKKLFKFLSFLPLIVDRLTDLVCLKQYTLKSPNMIEECSQIGFGNDGHLYFCTLAI